MVARALIPAHAVAVASPAYLQGRQRPQDPAALADFEVIAMRSPQSGRIKPWVMRNRRGEQMTAELRPRLFLNDPDAICRAALLGMGVGLLLLTDVVEHLESGALLRVLPDWYEDLGAVSLYYTSQKLMPAKTRALVDYVTAALREQQLAQRLTAA